MKIHPDAISRLQKFISNTNYVFENRPGMLGTPEEVCAVMNFLDDIEDMISGTDDVALENRSWHDFLIHKKLLHGARNKLREILRKDEMDYSLLQHLRHEYREWRITRTTG